MADIAALFVDPQGVYSTIEGVDVWGPDRDARLYDGPHPVVAHPPCNRWCKLARSVEARSGYRVGDDGGTFASALASVRKWGGVLEHPAESIAFRAHGLFAPTPNGGWCLDMEGGFACEIDQVRYGHPARKRTWLYAHQGQCAGRWAPPSLRWGRFRGRAPKVVGFSTNRCSRPMGERLGPKEASTTPRALAIALIDIARSIRAHKEVQHVQ